MQSYLGTRAPIQKAINRPRVGTPRAKWLNKLEDKENIGVLTRFIERYTKGYNKVVIKRQDILRGY